MSSITRDDWLAALRAVEPGDTTPPDALTASELQALFGLGKSATRDRLARLRKNGLVQQYRKRVVAADGRAQLVPAYVLVKETPDVLSRLEAPDARRLRRTRSRPRTGR